MTIAPLATTTPTPLDPKAAPTETPTIPFADVLAAIRAAPTAEPVASPAVQPPAPSCRPRAGIHPPASPTPVGDAAPWIPAQGRDDAEMPTSPSDGAQNRTEIEPSNHPGEGRGPATTGPQLDPGLRRGGAEEEPAHESFAPIAPPPATAAAINAVAPSVQQPIAVPELPPLPASPEPASAPIRAAVFNERGLLRDVGAPASEAVAWRTIAPGSPREARAAVPAAEPIESWPPVSLRTPERSAAPSPLSTTALDVSPDTNASPTSPAIVPAPTASPTTAAPTTTASLPIPQAAAQQHAVAAPTARIQTRQPTEPAAKRPAKPRAPEPREQQDATDTRLTLDAAPQGLTLLAAVARTDRDDRTRLRDRIDDLLSSRGFALADVRVGTAALPSPKDR